MKKHLGIRGAFCVLFEVSGACVLLAFCLICLKVVKVLSTVADEECIVFGVTVVLKCDLCLRLGTDDGVDRRSVRGITEDIIGNEDVSAVGGCFYSPEEDVVTHRLWPDFRATGQNSVCGGKANARTDAGVTHEFRANGNFITVFKCRHSVVFKAASPDVQVYRRGSFFTRSLMGDTGVIDVFEAAVFDKHVFRGNPELNRITEADFQLIAPHTATDIFKMAVTDGNVSATRTRDTVYGIVTEAKSVKDYVVTDKAEVGACKIDCLNLLIDSSGVADRVEIEVVFRGSSLTPLITEIVFRIHRVIEIPLSREVIDVIAKGGDTHVAVKHYVSDAATGLCGAEPDILTLGGNPILRTAYIGAAGKCGGIALTVCAVGDGSIGSTGGKLQDMVGGATLKKDGVAADKVKCLIIKGGGNRAFTVIM